MNHYPRHIGDYVKDAAHLTMLEDGAYSRMMDIYYAREKPLPTDRKHLHEIVRCRNAGERAAVDKVLVQFFDERADGWHQKRCDEELSRAREAGEESAARRENERERQARHRKRRKELFEALREYGSVPKWDTPLEQLETLLSRYRNGDSTVSVTRDKRDLQRLSNSQLPIANTTKSKALSGKPDVAPPIHVNGYKAKAVDVLGYLNKITGAHFQPRASSLAPIEARLKEGYSAERLKEIALLKAEQWGKDEKMAEFLRPKTLYNATNCANYDGILENGVDDAPVSEMPR
jgi:uncharacterized phage protein (TIGR02220 family)